MEKIESTGSSVMEHVEVIHVSSVNFIARGRRQGRWWLLKGLIEQRRNSPVCRRRLQKEYEIQSRLLGPGVAHTSSLEEIDGLGLCIVEEWIEGKTLKELLRNEALSVKERRRIMRDIVSVVGFIHSRGVIHRDLKPSNIMIRNDGGGVVLIDFGLADTDDYAELKQSAGTPGYVSPEQLRFGGAHVTDDIYSLGVIMRELMPGYGKIARKCTGPVCRRPKNAASLLKILERREKRPLRLLSFSVAAVILALVAAVAFQFSSLGDSFMEAGETVMALDESNGLQVKRVEELKDRLSGMDHRIDETERDIKGKDNESKLIYQIQLEAFLEIVSILKEFDEKIIPGFSGADKEYLDSIEALTS